MMIREQLNGHARTTAGRSSARRGVAMLLVIISLAFATIAAVAYLASRDNSSMIGTNIASGAQSRWAAESALDTVEALLQTETDWRTAHNDGVLFSDLNMGDAVVTVYLQDIHTLTPPTATTEFVQATAPRDGRRRGAGRVVHRVRRKLRR